MPLQPLSISLRSRIRRVITCAALLAGAPWVAMPSLASDDGAASGPKRRPPVEASAQDAGAPSGKEAERAVAEGNAALKATPPERDAARAAFERATAAGDAPLAVAEAYLRLGTLDEESGDLARALANHKACVAAAPESRWARNARGRIDWLDARSEGGFEPLARLKQLQKSREFADDPAVIEALARDAEAFPPGLVRAEARLIVGEAWLKHLHRTEDGIEELRKVLGDPASAKMNARNVALIQRDIVEALLAGGRLDEAAREVHARALDPSLVEDVDHLVQERNRVRVAGGVALALVCVVAALLAAWALRRRSKRSAG